MISLTTTDLRRIAHSIALMFCSEDSIKPRAGAREVVQEPLVAPVPLYVEVRHLIPVPGYRHDRL